MQKGFFWSFFVNFALYIKLKNHITNDRYF